MDVYTTYNGMDYHTARIKRHLDEALARFVVAPVVIQSGEYGRVMGHTIPQLPRYYSSMKNQEPCLDGEQITLRLDLAKIYNCYEDLMEAPFEVDLVNLMNASMLALEDWMPMPMPKWPFLMLLLVSEKYEFNTATSSIKDPQTFVKGWFILQRLAFSGTATGDIVKRCLCGRTGAEFLEKTGASTIPAEFLLAMLCTPPEDSGTLAPAVKAAVQAPRGLKALQLIKRSEPFSSPASALPLAEHPRCLSGNRLEARVS